MCRSLPLSLPSSIVALRRGSRSYLRSSCALDCSSSLRCSCAAVRREAVVAEAATRLLSLRTLRERRRLSSISCSAALALLTEAESEAEPRVWRRVGPELEAAVLLREPATAVRLLSVALGLRAELERFASAWMGCCCCCCG